MSAPIDRPQTHCLADPDPTASFRQVSTSTLADSASHVSDVLIVEQPGSASSIDLSLADLEAITVNGYLAALSRLADQRARACVITRSCIAQSGADGIKTLRQTDAKMPVLLLDDSDDAIPFALRAGFDDVLEPWRASTQLAEAAARRDWDRDGRHAVVLCSADTAFRRRTAETLELAGFLVLPVAGPWEALARLRERPVDVLITDLIMPELDGCELIEAARRYSPSVGCLAVAALSTSDDSPQTPDSEILHRPIDPLQLVAATRRSLAPEPVPEEPDALAGPRPSVLVLAPDWARARGVLQQLSESVETRFDVTWSARPSEVAARLARGEADAVIVDLDSSDAEGAEMCARLRVDADGVPIIALTGDKDTRAADKARACGAVISLSHSRIGQLASRLSLLLGGRDTSPDLPASLALEDSSEAVVLVDKERTIRFANRAAESLLGQELAGRPFPHPVAPHLETDFEVLVSGEIRTVEMRVRPARAAGGELVISLRDATQQRKNERRLRALSDQLREANRQIEALAYTDPLTRLPNRRGLERRLLSEAARARRSGSDLMALLVDCDSFKAVNDGHGHDVGDAVLVHVADAVVDAVRPTDLVSRVGGDEFLVLLPATREAEAVQVAERVRGGIADTAVEVGGLTVPMTVSLGVSRVPAETQSIQEVLAACHAALERSKGAGKNRVSF
ncbi:MAG: diguanylate cyclase (GGDEF)-like protein, partial [Myxococcota bacterium]